MLLLSVLALALVGCCCSWRGAAAAQHAAPVCVMLSLVSRMKELQGGAPCGAHAEAVLKQGAAGRVVVERCCPGIWTQAVLSQVCCCTCELLICCTVLEDRRMVRRRRLQPLSFAPSFKMQRHHIRLACTVLLCGRNSEQHLSSLMSMKP